MRSQQTSHEGATSARVGQHDRQSNEFPVREYVGAMAAELAQMARWDGDEQLGSLLDAAAEMAGRPPG